MADLDKCPFCGDKAYRIYSVGQYGTFGYIECGLCGCKTRSVKVLAPSQFKTELDFYEQKAWEPVERNWNRRKEARNDS